MTEKRTGSSLYSFNQLLVQSWISVEVLHYENELYGRILYENAQNESWRCGRNSDVSHCEQGSSGEVLCSANDVACTRTLPVLGWRRRRRLAVRGEGGVGGCNSIDA